MVSRTEQNEIVASPPDESREPDLHVLERIQERVLWLAVRMVDYANRERPPDEVKVGGHQASSASMVSIMTALWFGHLRRPVRALAWFVSVVLGLFSLVALGTTLISTVREAVYAAPPSPLGLWVFYLTYGSFLVYSVSLLGLCWSTRR